jgi:cobalt/nickel transport system ATP-binding protein
VLKLNGVGFKYEDKPVLKNISIDISNGERIALLGKNGCGKTTLFKCLCGLLKPNEGTITGVEDKHGSNIGLVFQEADTQIIGSTVEKEISFGLMNMRLSLEETRDKINRAVAQTGLCGLEQRAVHYLSGGEKKRVCIADILAMEPEIILFDEPTAFLDNYNVELFKSVLDTIDNTLIISTHDIDFAYEFADRFIIMSQGQIIADGGVEIFGDSDIIECGGIAMPKVWMFAKLMGISDYREYPRSMSELERLFKER